MKTATKINSYGQVLRSTGFYIVRCKCHTFRVEDGQGLWDVINGWQRCWDCGRAWKASEIFGRKTTHECNGKCMASKGPSCECGCGGVNHGRSYV